MSMVTVYRFTTYDSNTFDDPEVPRPVSKRWATEEWIARNSGNAKLDGTGVSVPVSSMDENGLSAPDWDAHAHAVTEQKLS